MELIKFSETYGNGGDYRGHQIYATNPAKNGIECPNCGKELVDDDPGTILESYPAQTSIACSCGFKASRYLSDEIQ